MNRAFIGILGVALIVVACASFIPLGPPLRDAYINGPGAQVVAQTWAYDAFYACILTVCLGLGLLVVAAGAPTLVMALGKSTRPVKAWPALLTACLIGIALANVVAPAIVHPAPCNILGCQPSAVPTALPVVLLVQAYPILSLVLVVISVLIAMVGFFLARRRQAPASLTRLLQLVPVLTVSLLGGVALLVFPIPVI